MGSEVRVQNAEGKGEADSTAKEAELDDGARCYSFREETRVSN